MKTASHEACAATGVFVRPGPIGALLVLAGLAVGPGGCRKDKAPPAAKAAAAIAPAPVQTSGFRRPSPSELKLASDAGFPVDFASCGKTPGTRTAVWSCGYKHDTHVAHDPQLRPCAPLVGQPPDAEWGISACALIYWDPTVKLPTTWDDCKARFVDEPGVIHVKGQDVCMVFVSLVDEKLFDQCRSMPFSEYRDGYCKYPLASPTWTPKGRIPAGGADDQGHSADDGHNH